MNRALRRSGITALTAATILATGASTWSDGASHEPPEGAAECQFAIRASNNISIDVWVDLYDSVVYLDGFGVLGRKTQLKIQNHRIAPRGTMDRRFTAPGRCARKRDWAIRFRRGTQQQTMFIHTEGTTSTSRTVDLGPASRWGD